MKYIITLLFLLSIAHSNASEFKLERVFQIENLASAMELVISKSASKQTSLEEEGYTCKVYLEEDVLYSETSLSKIISLIRTGEWNVMIRCNKMDWELEEEYFYELYCLIDLEKGKAVITDEKRYSIDHAY